MISGLLAPLMKPLGLGDWRICTSLISGFMAKESVVSTMNILFELEDGRLVPASEDLITAIDQEARTITMHIPEGLLEL